MIGLEHEIRDAQRAPQPPSLAREVTAALLVFVVLPATVGLVIASLAMAATAR